MEQVGEVQIRASRQEVWAALTDTNALKSCIEGCDSMSRDGHSFQAKVTAKIGPIRSKFAVEIKMINVDEHNSYTLDIRMKGGAAGFGSGRADVRLEDQDGGTRLVYQVQGLVGGKLAQIGSRLVKSAGRKFADDFFGNFLKLWEC